MAPINELGKKIDSQEVQGRVEFITVNIDPALLTGAECLSCGTQMVVEMRPYEYKFHEVNLIIRNTEQIPMYCCPMPDCELEFGDSDTMLPLDKAVLAKLPQESRFRSTLEKRILAMEKRLQGK